MTLGSLVHVAAGVVVGVAPAVAVWPHEVSLLGVALGGRRIGGVDPQPGVVGGEDVPVALDDVVEVAELRPAEVAHLVAVDDGDEHREGPVDDDGEGGAARVPRGQEGGRRRAETVLGHRMVGAAHHAVLHARGDRPRAGVAQLEEDSGVRGRGDGGPDAVDIGLAVGLVAVGHQRENHAVDAVDDPRLHDGARGHSEARRFARHAGAPPDVGRDDGGVAAGEHLERSGHDRGLGPGPEGDACQGERDDEGDEESNGPHGTSVG